MHIYNLLLIDGKEDELDHYKIIIGSQRRAVAPDIMSIIELLV